MDRREHLGTFDLGVTADSNFAVPVVGGYHRTRLKSLFLISFLFIYLLIYVASTIPASQRSLIRRMTSF